MNLKFQLYKTLGPNGINLFVMLLEGNDKGHSYSNYKK
jgi:hypothetical protein